MTLQVGAELVTRAEPLDTRQNQTEQDG